MTNHLQVGAPLPLKASSLIQPYQSGFTFEYGANSPVPTIYVGLENPSMQEVQSLSSAGMKEYGICNNGPMTFLLGRYSMNGHPILSFDAPYHAGLPTNLTQEFIDNLKNIESQIATGPNLGLSLTTIAFDLHSLIVLGINICTLPNRSSLLLLKHALKQASSPIGYEDYASWVEQTYSRYPSWNSMRKSALSWQKSNRTSDWSR